MSLWDVFLSLTFVIPRYFLRLFKIIRYILFDLKALERLVKNGKEQRKDLLKALIDLFKFIFIPYTKMESNQQSTFNFDQVTVKSTNYFIPYMNHEEDFGFKL